MQLNFIMFVSSIMIIVRLIQKYNKINNNFLFKIISLLKHWITDAHKKKIHTVIAFVFHIRNKSEIAIHVDRFIVFFLFLYSWHNACRQKFHSLFLLTFCHSIYFTLRCSLRTTQGELNQFAFFFIHQLGRKGRTVLTGLHFFCIVGT